MDVLSDMDALYAGGVILLPAFLFAFLITILSLHRFRHKQDLPDTASVLVVVGSGGHTKEILTMTEKLGHQYSPRQYVVASTDSMSIKKIIASEETHHASDSKSSYAVYTVPRSREVKQSWFTTVFTTLYASVYSLRLVIQLKPRIILCNGPGTCVPLCYAGLLLKDSVSAFWQAIHAKHHRFEPFRRRVNPYGYLKVFTLSLCSSKWLGIADTKIVYVESICRVETLSLSAKLLYPVADSLIVQWPNLLEKYPKCKYIGRTV